MADEPTETAGGGAEVFEGVLSLMVHGSRIKIWMKGSMLMVQGMKRQNGISKMKSINMGDDKKEKIMIVHH